MIPEPSAAAASRSSEKNANSQAEATSSGAISPSEDESGNENRQKSVRRRRRACSISENVKSKRARASGSSVRRARGKRAKEKQVEAVTLFEVITMGKSAIQAVIDDWIEAYVTDRDASLLDLISFFIQCCGCKGAVTAEMCQSKEDKHVKSKMVEELDEAVGLQYKRFLAFPWILTVTWPMDADSAEYPLVQSRPSGRWFHSEFCDFVSVLVAQCQHSVLFDSYLMNSLISLLTELSNSYVRAFRHTCTLAAVKLLSSLLSVALSLSVGIENSQKLYNVQRTKTVRQKTQQLERMQKKISELQEKRAEVESMMDVIFKGVFLKRYRDMLPEIRSVCMEELGLWMKLYSSSFLNDSYLKYMGWMMHDKVPDVRLKCVLALQGLFGDPVLLPKLDLFISRFKNRLISMVLDKDNEVAVQTMKLLVLISRATDDVLTSEDYKQLLQVVYSSHRPLSATAGELLYSRILSAAAPTSDNQDERNEEDERRRQMFDRLKALLRFYQEFELHKHVVYLVDSLWDCGGSLLKDWPTLTAALLQNSSGFTPAEQAVIVEILVASVRQATEGPALVGRSGAKKIMSNREKKIQADDCLKLTEHLFSVLPKLLSKFSCSGDTVASLMRIPQYFHPDSQEAKNTQSVSSLMTEMAAVLDLHSGPAVLEAAARTYLSLCGDGAAWAVAAGASRDSLVQRWVDRLTEKIGESLRRGCFSAEEDETSQIVATLKKLRAFHNCHDLSRWNVFELLSPLLTEDGSLGGPSPEVLEEALQCMSFAMLWSLSTSSQTLTCREKAVAQRLQLRLFCDRSYRCLSHCNHSVKNQAFLGVCDVLTAHSYQLQVWDPTCFGPLLYTPSPKLQRALLTFVCVNVFVVPDGDNQSRVSESSEVERLEELHRRRNLLAAYCKLIVHGVLETSTAAEIYTHYVKHYSDFGDIIKETISRTRQTDKIESTRTLVLCLQQLFVQLKREQESGGRAHSGVQTFTCIKELARRFALTFGDLVKFRECLVMIHRNGVEFVFQEFRQAPDNATPPYLSYLTILSEFSNKLLKPDKKAVLSYLQKHTAEHIIDLREECWQPLIYYRATLLAVAEMEDAVSYVSSDRRPGLHSRSPVSKQKLEGYKSPSQGRPTEQVTKVNKPSFSHSSQVNPGDTDPFSVPPELHGRSFNMAATVLGINGESDDGSVDIEL
ncbi:PREDICTED: cohesin subunit SA-2-like [Poecilia mexicana]|uniref:Cohesin subunit SA n=1 Tax=Poecilia mexicana TaxID=48701 RepID=A0A3B3X7R9_9TELE|nr:PREDICTED: cohesin subunit SA-2-like [Poecilia mexicana]